MLKAGFLELVGGGEREKKKKDVGLVDSSMDVVGMESNFPSLGIHNVINARPIPYINVVSADPTSPSENESANKNGSEQVGNEHVNKFPSSYATKLSPTSSTKANLRKLEVNVPTHADYDVWLPLALVHDVNDRMKNSLYGYFIGKMLAFPVVECDNLVMVVLNLEGNGYTKEKICVEYEWEPPYYSNCLIHGHSLFYCPKVAPKRVVNNMNKCKGHTSRADDEGFIEVRKKKSSEKGQSSTPIVEKINVLEKYILEGKLVLMDDVGKTLEKVDYPNNLNSDDEVERVVNETTSFLALKGVGYGLKSLWEQRRDTTVYDE
ncbi:hypothetical protein Tco_0195729 [Tanacetum coccineum]